MTFPAADGLPARRRGLLIATADGYAPDWVETWGQDQSTFRTHSDPVKGVPIELQLALDDVPIHGQFLDPDGRPLAAARVRVAALMIPRWRDLDRHLQIEEVPWTTVDFARELYQPHLVPGLVTETRTDAEGRFTLSGIGRDRFAQLEVSAPNIVDTSLRVMTRKAPDFVVRSRMTEKPAWTIPGADFQRQLERGKTIKGRVVDRDTYQGIAGMHVGPLVNAVTQFNPDLYPYITDGDGRFTISGRSPARDKETIVAVAGPGLPYQTAWVDVQGEAEVAIQCPLGIPYRLKLVDDEGKPVDAEVSYVDVHPNPHHEQVRDEVHWPVNLAAQDAGGNYRGFVLPGPGAVLVKPTRGLYRSARVDPQAFFAPRRNDWTPLEQTSSHAPYGTLDTLTISKGRYLDTLYRGWTLDQAMYSAIVLVNPAADSGPLELSATVVREKLPQVTLLDADGQTVVGAKMNGQPLRAASFPLRGLASERPGRFKFTQDERKLVGSLLARSDADAAYTVPMQPWGTVTGRLVDEHGDAFPIGLPVSDWQGPPLVSVEIPGDPKLADRQFLETDKQGRFRISALIPGQPYRGKLSLRFKPSQEVAFENVLLGAGEVRDLGDVRTGLSYEPHYLLPAAENQPATPNIPAESWGEPVDGLRVAVVVRTPHIDERNRLRYDIVAENVSDHEIRFAAVDAYDTSYYRTSLVDADGNQVPRQPGGLHRFINHPHLVRFRLLPRERAVISPATSPGYSQLVKLDPTGQPISGPEQSRFYHSFQVKPGRFRLSVAVELGSGLELDPDAGARTVQFAAKGEWTGKLQSGTVAVTLFEDP